MKMAPTIPQVVRTTKYNVILAKGFRNSQLLIVSRYYVCMCICVMCIRTF